jgi:hypothetical protein
LGKILGIHWKLKGNKVGTREKWKKILALKGKKGRHLECMLGPSHWVHEISFLKRVCHHFWSGLISLAKNTLPIDLPSPVYLLLDGLPPQVLIFVLFFAMENFDWPIIKRKLKLSRLTQK